MNDEKEKKLVDKYPSLFQLHNLSNPSIESPKPQINIFGLQCGDGWYDLIESTCEYIEKVDENNTIYFVQIKEKFGGLRIYYQSDEVVKDEDEIRSKYERVMGAIQVAEHMSYKICELCGNKGIHHTDSYYKTRCDECYKDVA